MKANEISLTEATDSAVPKAPFVTAYAGAFAPTNQFPFIFYFLNILSVLDL